MKDRIENERTLTREDRALIGRIASGLDPGPMDAVRAARFRRAITGRRDERRIRSRVALVAAATAAAAAVLWLATPDAPAPRPAEVAVEAPAAGELPPLSVAYADPDAYGEDLTPAEYLPEDYLALATLLELDV